MTELASDEVQVDWTTQDASDMLGIVMQITVTLPDGYRHRAIMRAPRMEDQPHMLLQGLDAILCWVEARRLRAEKEGIE